MSRWLPRRSSAAPISTAHLELLERYERAGFDEVYVQQVGPDLDGFFTAYEREVLTRYPTADGREADMQRQGTAAT